ncbi:MAG: metal ABC transporter ATP-binding protein [Synechococcaceae cyanobacterium SM2_3_1]|nr:metal ABC transporter ATP-binding protein [Synechococcaceae cyanobacterium SM2_3_1]
MLQIGNLSVHYRGLYALQNLSFSVEPGQLVGVIGPNGAGKSTLIKAMLGLIPCSDGTVHFNGFPIAQQLLKVAYVPQRTQVDWDYPTTVWNVVMTARTRQTGLFRKPDSHSLQLVCHALERVGIWNLRDRQIGKLSGGQQQRVFMARALAQAADLLLFDEPFTGVDRQTEEIFYLIFKELRDQGKSLLVIHHNLEAGMQHYDKLVLLNKTLIAIGNPTSVLSDRNVVAAYGHRLVLLSA